MVLGLPVNADIELTDDLDSLAQQQLADFELLETQLNLEQNVDYKIADNLGSTAHFRMAT